MSCFGRFPTRWFRQRNQHEVSPAHQLTERLAETGRLRQVCRVTMWLRLLVSVGFSAATLCPAPSCAEDSRSALPRADRTISDQGRPSHGREIYERFLDNKFRASFQRLRVVSRDPGGSEQLTHIDVKLQDFRDEQKRPSDGIKAKMLIEVTAPFDMRHAAYLIVSKEPGPDDGFAYQPSERRVRRMDLKNTSLFGTDYTFYTFNEIAFVGIDDAEYVRHPDEEIDGTPVYVVEANFKKGIDVEYHRTITYIEKEHYVALRMRYWDQFGVEAKEMTAPHSQLRAFGATWIATESTMTDLRQRTSSSIYVDELDTDPQFDARAFTLSNLARGH